MLGTKAICGNISAFSVFFLNVNPESPMSILSFWRGAYFIPPISST